MVSTALQLGKSQKAVRASSCVSSLDLQNIEIPEQARQLRSEDDELREEIENRTNRQLRRTLVFKNIPETKDDESYQEVKALLAKTISEVTDISEQEAFAGIERAHREAKRDGGYRQGKRKIFAAFLNWDLPQTIIDQFRKKNIADRSLKIYAEQMYGPLTSLRRNLAFQTRKALCLGRRSTNVILTFHARKWKESAHNIVFSCCS